MIVTVWVNGAVRVTSVRLLPRIVTVKVSGSSSILSALSVTGISPVRIPTSIVSSASVTV